MADLTGFLAPKTPSGASAIVPDMPWYYSGTLLTAEYRTDPANVAALLPEGLELADDDPGAVALIWADWQSCSASGAELLDPQRSQYLETFAVVRVKHEGVTYSRCVAIWVTKDFAIARGWFQGYPKKLGSMAVTRVMNVGRAAPRLEPGAKLGASLAAYDHRLASLVVTLREPSDTNGFVNGHAMLHSRWMPSITPGAGNSLDQLITMGGVDAEIGATWVGDFELELHDSPWDELASILPVQEKIAAYYREVGVTFNGGKLVADRSNPTV
ncbi:acetoacetate decarboxylase family protein [Microcella frigidaquae]|uniref:Acetoacetate decarboxylase n=1 Tax=Microcella frigidaquae TaxID=424758 RepID=A0A840X8E0_9MICO|nr:acetoacetate decarboxylase family protein [Microcella frigidaquae]MBB5617395.1 acetoacetate decarboxylase [Microcella frigidaquae]NHN45572.1 acetoacetate decarboxylase family protein [Microcella frigidaquae]